MNKENNIEYVINYNVVKNYVDAVNGISSQIDKELENIKIMSNSIQNLFNEYPKEKSKISIDVIRQIMNANNGTITTTMIKPLNISRQYLFILKNNKEIEKISKGIYISKNIFEDSYYSFQLRYKKVIYSHMNALYFYGITEEFPYRYTVTVPKNYHVDAINEKCNVFYASDDIYELGVVMIETPSGNKVKSYDLERTICDIIKAKNRMDPEQVKKSIKLYIQRKDKNLNKLSEYSKKMGINELVMEMVGMYYD